MSLCAGLAQAPSSRAAPRAGVAARRRARGSRAASPPPSALRRCCLPRGPRPCLARCRAAPRCAALRRAATACQPESCVRGPSPPPSDPSLALCRVLPPQQLLGRLRGRSSSLGSLPPRRQGLAEVLCESAASLRAARDAARGLESCNSLAGLARSCVELPKVLPGCLDVSRRVSTCLDVSRRVGRDQVQQQHQQKSSRTPRATRSTLESCNSNFACWELAPATSWQRSCRAASTCLDVSRRVDRDQVQQQQSAHAHQGRAPLKVTARFSCAGALASCGESQRSCRSASTCRPGWSTTTATCSRTSRASTSKARTRSTLVKATTTTTTTTSDDDDEQDNELWKRNTGKARREDDDNDDDDDDGDVDELGNGKSKARRTDVADLGMKSNARRGAPAKMSSSDNNDDE